LANHYQGNVSVVSIDWSLVRQDLCTAVASAKGSGLLNIAKTERFHWFTGRRSRFANGRNRRTPAPICRAVVAGDAPEADLSHPTTVVTRACGRRSLPTRIHNKSDQLVQARR